MSGLKKDIWRKNLQQCGCMVVAVAASGCMVGPDYEKPQLVMPDSWHMELVDGLEAGNADPGAWWIAFNDPILVELVQLAEQRNLDLRSAVSSIREARDQYGIAAADLFPQVSLNTSADFTSGNARAPEIEQVNGPPFVQEGYSDQAYNMGLDLGWEVDLWGKVRRSMQSAQAEVAMTIEDWRDILVTVRAEVAQSYIATRSFQLQIKSLKQTIDSQAQTLKLVQQQYDAGVANDLFVAQAQASLADLMAQMPALVESLAQSINRLSVLIGEAPGPLRTRLAQVEPVPQPPDEIGVGIPADIIRRRPDIRAAERALASATAQVGVAEAALYPALQITGSGGFSSTQFSQWFDSSGLGGMLGIQVSWPFFTAGRLQAVVRVTNEQTLQALYSYEQTVLNAIEDVENALIAYVQTLRERQQLRASVAAYQRVVKLAKDRYTRGADDLQTLLDAERYLSQAEQTLAQVEGQVSANVVILYKALGGAWEVVPKGTSGAETVAKEESRKAEKKQEVSG